MAPKKDQVLKIVNKTSIQIYPSAWEQETSAACPIVKLTIEYRSSSVHKWKLLSSQGISDEVIELSNLINRSIYSLRMTAHTRTPASAPTMAEYEARIGLEDPADHSHEPYSEITKGLLTDPSTVISLASSVFVLCVGFIAVACLVTYKRRLNQKLTNSQRHKKHNRRTSATSAASTMQSTILTEESNPNRRSAGNPVAKLNIQKTSLPPIPVDAAAVRRSGEKASGMMQQQVIRITGQSSNVSVSVTGSKGSSTGAAAGSSCNMIDSQINSSSNSNITINSRKSPFKNGSHQMQQHNHHHDPVRGKLPNVCIPRKQLDEIENDIYNEYDEITPYATFRLHDDDPGHVRDNEETGTEEFKTFREFTVRIGEPAYCFKVHVCCIPLSTCSCMNVPHVICYVCPYGCSIPRIKGASMKSEKHESCAYISKPVDQRNVRGVWH